MMELKEVKEFLDAKVVEYNSPSFIETDPILIPKLFSRKEDIEISGFLTATISWGKRPMILSNAKRLMALLDNAPFEFVMGAGEDEFRRLTGFVHRTFNGEDCVFFLQALRRIYQKNSGLETVFSNGFAKSNSIEAALSHFRSVFFDGADNRSSKHVGNVLKNSAAKRLNMFLRWMVRSDGIVDFGIWKNIPVDALKMPLDVHSGRVARKLGLLLRRADDWKAVIELTERLAQFSPKDPVKYDFALFGLGVFEQF